MFGGKSLHHISADQAGKMTNKLDEWVSGYNKLSHLQRSTSLRADIHVLYSFSE